MILRPYQQTLIAVAQEAMRSKQSLLLVAPCGSGKTVCFSAITASLSELDFRTTIVVHRAELLEQVSRTLTAFDVEHGCIAPGYPWKRKAHVQVASVLSLVRRLADYPKPDLLIIDEAHHAASPSWRKLFSAYPHTARLGVTATPERLDSKGLNDIFGSLHIGPSVRELIDLGALCDYKVFAPPVTYTEGIHRRMGDYDKHELSAKADTPTLTGNAVEHYRKLADGRRALAFCVSVQHAAHVAHNFRTAGYAAAALDGTMDRAHRRTLVGDFISGQLTILTSCDLVSEGFDLPAIEVALLLRPTMSLALHLQQVGRALRLCPGKNHAIILDHAGNTHRHGLPDEARDWSLIGRQASKVGSGEAMVSLRTCGACFLAVKAPAATCPHCGYVFPEKPREIEEVAGELEEVDQMAERRKNKFEQAQARDLAALQMIEKQRGYKPGWAQYVMNARRQRKMQSSIDPYGTIKEWKGEIVHAGS